MSALTVSLENELVGVLELRDERCRFIFNEDWLSNPDRSVLGQFFEDRRPRTIDKRDGLLCWFVHLLPQGPIRRLIAKQHNLDADEDFDLLTALGEDLPGAVRMRPVETTPVDAHHFVVEPPQHPSDITLGFSLAGMQYKLSVRDGERGLVIPAINETGEFIAKFHDPQHGDLPRLEYATMRWAEATGIDIPEIQLIEADRFEGLPPSIPLGKGQVFLTRRFDRSPDRRIHIEDFAQVLDRPNPYHGNYEEAAVLLNTVALEVDLRAFVHQLVFSILCGNSDAHLKNWSLIYPDRRQARLSLAYDLVPAVLFGYREMALRLQGSNRYEDVSIRSFDTMARATRRTSVELTAWVEEAVQRTKDTWTTIGPDLGFTKEEQTRLQKHMTEIVL